MASSFSHHAHLGGRRVLNREWYDANPPPDDNPSWTTFVLGLAASPSASIAPLNELFTKHCVEHHLWDLPHPVKSADSLPAYYAVTEAISQAVREKYPGAPQRWVESWVRGLVMASYDRPRAPFFPASDDDVEDTRPLPGPSKITIPLHQMTFILNVHPTLTITACILEIVSTRCLRQGYFGDHPSEYRLSLFQTNLRSMLQEKTGTEVDLRRGRLQWIRNGALETIENQHDFETALTQLYNERSTGWELVFLFVPATEEELEILSPSIYVPLDTSMYKGKGKERCPDHKEPRIMTLEGADISLWKGMPKEIVSEQDGIVSSIVQTVGSRAPQPTRNSNADKGDEVAVADKIENQIDDVITKTRNWAKDGEDARKKAEQRVKAAKRKEREKQAQGEGQARRAPRSSSRTPSSVVASTSSSERSASPASSRTTARPTPSNRNKALPVLPVSTPSNASQSNPGQSAGEKQSNSSLRSTSSEALPYAMTDKERREKVMRVRRQFPGREMPGLVATEKALLETKGGVDEAVVHLGGRPKKGNVSATPTRGPLRRAGLMSPPESAGSVKTGGKSAAGDEKGERGSSRYRWIKKGEVPREGAAPPTSLLTPPPSDTKEKNSKLSFQQRLQNAAHSAGRRISLSSSSTPKHETGHSSSGPSSPKSPGLRSMLGAFKRRSSQAVPPSERESKYYEFVVTKERAYRSGGDEDDAINPLDGYLQPDEELESDDEDEEGEKPVKKTKDIASLLRDIQNSKGLAQLTEPGGDESDMKRWLDCCRLFQIDPSKTGMKERVHIVGIKQPLFQYQGFSVYWQMLNSRRFGGGFVADTPGLGKTFVFLSLIVVERQLCILWDEVNQSRKTKDGKHLPLTGQLADDVCPSRNDRPGWIACPCVFSNPTSQMPAQPGVRIAIVPASLMSNWRVEWRKAIDTTCEDLDMRLLLAHEGSVADRAEMNEMAIWPANITALRADKVEKAPDSAKANQDRFLVLTTAQSYDAWIERFKYTGQQVMVQELNVLRTKYGWTSGFKQNIQFGIACVDESHEEYNIEKGRGGVLGRLPGNPMCWGYSGTPLDKSPRCLEGVLWALEKQAKKIDIESVASGWAQSHEMKNFRREVFDKACKEFESGIRSGTFNAAILENLEKQLLPFLSTFMIRRTPESRWFGHPLLALNSNLHRDVFLMHNEKYDEEIKALTPEIEADAADRLQKLQAMWDKAPEIQRPLERPRALGFNNKIHTQYKLRILATCPALIKLTTGENALTLKTDELRKWRGGNEKNSPYAKNITEIFENSPKLMWLRECILDIEKHRDIDGAEQKMIIITNFNCIAFIVKLMIEHYIPFKKGRVGLMYADISSAVRTATLEAFTDAMTENKQGDAVRKRKENIQFLIGTTAMLSKGLQLTRACNVVLMEPDHEFYRELQGYARVTRIGQRNPWTFSYRLIDDKSEVEKSILQRQRERGEFPGRVLKAGDVEKMGPRDDGGSIEESDDLERPVSWMTPKKMLTMLEPTLKKKEGVSDLRGRGVASKPGGKGQKQ